MSVFYLPVGDKEYKMEFTRDSVRQFEAAGYSVAKMSEKIYTSIDGLMYVGLMGSTPGMNPGLAKKITDSALSEYDVFDLYTALTEEFAKVFMNGDDKPRKKKKVKLAKAPAAAMAEQPEMPA